MVNKGLLKQFGDKVAKAIAEETDELALAACAAGVPVSEMQIISLHPYIKANHPDLVGHTLRIGDLSFPIVVQIFK